MRKGLPCQNKVSYDFLTVFLSPKKKEKDIKDIIELKPRLRGSNSKP